ncbi:transmembrane emp24 domain-containing protein 4-like [Clavelina lepadiformis]|uniref:transmembrane emp24 domain-containing protein 4-like n=1 Tax=Clavelina lepadiformis TaxID=159417 RepID=UPI004042E8BD
MGLSEKKCFIEDIPEDIMVLATYRMQTWDEKDNVFIPCSPEIGMRVHVIDPNGQTIVARNFGSNDSFTFTTYASGEQQICLSSNTSDWSRSSANMIRVFLDLKIGEHVTDYKEMAEKEKVSNLEVRIQELIDQLINIQQEQEYHRYRENIFRILNEQTNSSMFWWFLAQLITLFISGIWQMSHLKEFFKAKKLVVCSVMFSCFVWLAVSVTNDFISFSYFNVVTNISDDQTCAIAVLSKLED